MKRLHGRRATSCARNFYHVNSITNDRPRRTIMKSAKKKLLFDEKDCSYWHKIFRYRAEQQARSKYCKFDIHNQLFRGYECVLKIDVKALKMRGCSQYHFDI